MASRPPPLSDLVYQIFPDRWNDARPDLTPSAGSWRWRGHPIQVSRDPAVLTRHPEDQYTFFGGDLEGIRRSVPYLQELGVGMVYLTPIFAARSTHRYDAVDHFRVDPALGSHDDYLEMVAELREHAIDLALDGVFNHTSEDHPWHQDRRLRRRHYILRDREHAMTWMGQGTLPKLDTQDPTVARMVLDALSAWKEADVWRLDAAHLLPRELLRRIRDHVAPRPVVVEDWTYARHYFDAGLADGVTNFLFREAMRSFFTEDLSPETLLERLRVWIEGYPPAARAASWNFLDNHDTPRFRTLVGRERTLRALVLLFTLPGRPLLYHGIEVGLEGRTEGEARTPMRWDRRRWDRPMCAHVQRLAALRREHPALVRGRFRALAADNRSRTLVFERRLADQRAVVALNDGYQAFRRRIDGTTMDLGPGEWRVLVERRGHPPRVVASSAGDPRKGQPTERHAASGGR